MLKTFIISYFQLLLLAILSRLTNREQYLGMIVVNISVGILYCFMFKNLLEQIDNPMTVVAYVAGTTFGSVSGVYLHHKWSKK